MAEKSVKYESSVPAIDETVGLGMFDESENLPLSEYLRPVSSFCETSRRAFPNRCTLSVVTVVLCAWLQENNCC